MRSTGPLLPRGWSRSSALVGAFSSMPHIGWPSGLIGEAAGPDHGRELQGHSHPMAPPSLTRRRSGEASQPK